MTILGTTFASHSHVGTVGNKRTGLSFRGPGFGKVLFEDKPTDAKTTIVMNRETWIAIVSSTSVDRSVAP